MQPHTIPSLRGLLLVFLLPLIWIGAPVQALAHNEQVAQATEPAQPEGSQSQGYGHGSPHGMPGGPHGKPEGSGSMHGEGKGYSHGSQHGYSKHGYGKHDGSHGGHGYGGRHHGGHGGHDQDPFRHILRFAHELGLSAEQVAQIRDNQFAFQKQRIELKAQHAIAHLELDKLVHSGNVDESAIRAVGTRLKQIKSQKIDGMIEAKIALLKLLTDDQKKKIATLHSHSGGKGHH